MHEANSVKSSRVGRKKMNRTKNKVILVAGGTEAIGGGIVRKFLANGASVVVPSDSAEKLAALRSRLADFDDKFLEKNLLLLKRDIGTEEGAARVRDEVLQHYERIDAVIACLGGSWHGLRLVNVPLETWYEILHDNLTAHFIVAKNFLPVLLHLDAGDYFFIANRNGVEAAARSVPACAAIAGQIMLACGLALENRRSKVRIHTIIPGAVGSETEENSVRDDFITNDDIADFVVELAACRTKFSDGKPISLADKTQFAEVLKELRGTAESRYL